MAKSKDAPLQRPARLWYRKCSERWQREAGAVRHGINTFLRTFGYQLIRSETLDRLVREGRPQGVQAATTAVSEAPLFATHHPVFGRFKPWAGRVPAGFVHTCVGSFARDRFWHNIRSDHAYDAAPAWPEVNEEYFEWVDLLEAVADAGDSFVMVELGAGYGRWCVAAACAARHARPGLPVRLIAVEAEPGHFEMLRQHLSDNGLDPDSHRLLQHAVNGTGGEVSFVSGHADQWYGQSIIPEGSQFGDWPEGREIKVKALTLGEILADEPFVDLIDMDVQGAEAEIVEASSELLTARVRRLHIGTHSHDVEDRIFRTLAAAGWHCTQSFRSGTIVDTHYGRVQFGDGAQSWLNPRLF